MLIMDRTILGAETVDHFNELRGESDETETDSIDAITDILHYCASQKIDVDRVLRSVTNHIHKELHN
jgi:hypothetical protein